MISLLLVCLVVLGILALAEVTADRGWLSGESSRKLVHMLVGSFVATWPYYLDWNSIRLMSIAFAVVVLLSTRVKVFQSIRAVRRLSYGEMFFALSVGLLTLITDSKDIYFIAVLQMALADGVAALVGVAHGKGNSYKVFGHTKSIAGTAAFATMSLLIFTAYSIASGNDFAWQHVALAVGGATLLENLGIFGLDNLLVPVYIGLLLNATV